MAIETAEASTSSIGYGGEYYQCVFSWSARHPLTTISYGLYLRQIRVRLAAICLRHLDAVLGLGSSRGHRNACAPDSGARGPRYILMEMVHGGSGSETQKHINSLGYAHVCKVAPFDALFEHKRGIHVGVTRARTRICLN